MLPKDSDEKPRADMTEQQQQELFKDKVNVTVARRI